MTSEDDTCTPVPPMHVITDLLPTKTAVNFTSQLCYIKHKTTEPLVQQDNQAQEPQHGHDTGRTKHDYKTANKYGQLKVRQWTVTIDSTLPNNRLLPRSLSQEVLAAGSAWWGRLVPVRIETDSASSAGYLPGRSPHTHPNRAFHSLCTPDRIQSDRESPNPDRLLIFSAL